MQQLRVGIVGAAGRGRSFFSAFICNPHTRLVALCDINEAGVRQTAAEVGVELVYTGYEEMLDKANLDIVMVGTPMHWHVPQALQALSRGMHVLCEVPAAVSLEEAHELVLACANEQREIYDGGELLLHAPECAGARAGPGRHVRRDVFRRRRVSPRVERAERDH